MGWHRKIDVRMYGDEKFRTLSRAQPNAQTLWIYLLTGPHANSVPGLYHIGEMGLAEALGWLPEGLREPFRELSRKGMVEADWDARVVWVPNAIKYNEPENPNVVIGWRNLLDMIPECELKHKACKALYQYVAKKETLSKGLAKAFPNGMPNQEQEQEQEQEEDKEEECCEPPLADTQPPSAAVDPNDPIILEFPTNRKNETWKLTDSKVAEYRESFPAVDVLAQLRIALQWCRDNPTKRKTATGMPAFLTRWLGKEQNGNGHGPGPPRPPARSQETMEERRERLNKELA